jgi:hypothetical protein
MPKRRSLIDVVEELAARDPGFRDQDSRDFAHWHIRSKTNTVDDNQRSTKFSGGRTSSQTSLDRSGNVDAPYRASTQVYDRKLHRHGHDDDESERENDLGRPYREGGTQNRSTGRAGVGTALPIPQIDVTRATKVNEAMAVYHEQERRRGEQRVRGYQRYIDTMGQSAYWKK